MKFYDSGEELAVQTIKEKIKLLALQSQAKQKSINFLSESRLTAKNLIKTLQWSVTGR